jgi:hypothetical protein
MPCVISDYLSYYNSTLAAQGLQNQQVLAVPGANFYRIKVSSTFRVLGPNPGITSSVLKLGIIAVTDMSGLWSLTLPYGDATETHPSSPAPQWSIMLPDGRIFSGVVPSVAGPLALDDLITTYSWVLNTSVYVAPVTPGTLARGTAAFDAATTATVLLNPAFSSSAYVLTLTPSVDSGTGDVVDVGYSDKSTTGFTIHASASFSGTVDWQAAE